MRDEMIAKLAKFFNKYGDMDRSRYISHPHAPYALREIRREFKRFDAAIDLVRAVKKVEKPKVIDKAPKEKQAEAKTSKEA